MLRFLLLCEGLWRALGDDATVSSSTATSAYQIRPGWEFSVEVQGTNFDVINDKILLIPSDASCGDTVVSPRGKYSSAAEYYDLMCDGIGKAPTKLVCSGVQVYQAGTYTICICDASATSRPVPPSAGSNDTTTTSTTMTAAPCNTPARFWLGGLDKGVVTVNGPRNEGALTWRAGKSDRLIIQGTGLSSGDRIRIVDASVDCFDPTHSKVMHPAVATDTPYADPSGQRNDGGETQERWLDIGVMVPGIYQVCWCSANLNGCANDADFTTKVAALVVGGPTANVIQTFECITGVACTLPITGSGLTDNDRIFIIADYLECGYAQQSSAVSQGAGTGGTRSSGSASLSRFGGLIMGRHGNFKVCWCGSYDPFTNPTGCSTMEQYTVYAGNVTSGGPIQGQVDRPPVGVPFIYTITGWGMSDVDRIRIVDKDVICGQAGASVHSLGLEASTVPNGQPSRVEGDASMNRTSVSWTNIVAREMRTYRVCWCAHNYQGCNQDAHFALDVGVINPRGAANTTMISAIPGRPFSLTVNAADGSTLTGDDRIRIVRSEVSDGKCGGFGTSVMSPAVSDIACWPTCVDSPVFGAPQMGTNNESEVWDPVLIMESGEYNICWCNSGNGGCDSDQDFAFKAGVIIATGVDIGLHFHCAAYFPCVVEVPLTDGLSSSDYLQMVPAAPSARCGTDTRAPATSFSRGTRVKGYTGRDTDGKDVVIFEFGSPQAPGVYLACYCQGNVCSGATSDQDFFQQAGQVTVMGLQGRDDYHKCYLRGTCKLSLRGAGLDEQDALMLVDPMDNCAQTGQPVSFSVDGSQFYTGAGDRIFIGTFASSTNEGLESWSFELGSPVRTGRFRLCYCSRTRATNSMCQDRVDFDQPAGELFVRGSEFSSELRCDQGEPCYVTARGAQFSNLDRMILLKTGSTGSTNHSCGMINGGQYPHWSSALTPQTIQPDAILPDLWAATWLITSVREPGTYHICYCANIVGGGLCVDSGTTYYERFQHELGTVRVTGSILAVRQVGITPTHWKPKLPAAPYAVSVEVDVLTTFMKYTCIATTRPAPEGFVPTKSDLENCTVDIDLLTDRQKFFPRCWGIGTTVETVTEMGPNVVHVPTHVPQSNLDTAVNMHVWCFPRDLCSNDRCVMPANNEGLLVPLTGGLVSYSNNWAATVATPFSLRLPLASDFDLGDEWARLKIITHDSACDTTQLHRSVMGITCLESGVGKCEPAPTSTLSSGSWGSGRELMWSGIAVNRADTFHVCYCDRHYASTCMAWVKVGTLQVKGPQVAGSMRFVANPGESAQITVQGVGLATEDRLRIIPQTVGCMAVQEASTTMAAATTSARRLQFTSVFDFRSGAAAANGTEASWEILISVEGTYNVCWCGGLENSCTAPDEFQVPLGTLQVAQKRDCQVTDWWVVDECNKVCGGGEVNMRRAITQEATGGGEACPSQSELYKVEQCNMNPCPLARLDRVVVEPAKLYAGSPFQLTIEGEWLDPDSDRIVLVDKDQVCGATQVHHGGAACDQYSSSNYRLVCGNGVSSIRMQRPGTYKICVCDASASIQKSFDGTTNITTGNFEAAGVIGSGCATPDLYIHNPEEGAILEVFEAPVPQSTVEQPGLDPGVTVAIVAGVLFGLAMLGLAGACWARQRAKAKHKAKVADEATSKEGKEGLQAGVDPAVLQFYESYYQSMGYPPGTAAQVLGQQSAQLSLPAPMMAGGFSGMAPAGTPALQDASAWMAPRPMSAPLQLALPPSRHPGVMASPPTPTRGRSPRGVGDGKSFGDLVSESNRRPSRQLPLFTDTSLPKMPTPTATPRGVATPRAEGEHTLALEDGQQDAGEVGVTISKSLEDVKDKDHRPSTSESVLSCLSESTAGSGPSRPGTGDSKDAEAAAVNTLPVVKEEKEEDKDDKDKESPSSFRTFFNDRVSKLLSSGEERKPLFSFSGSFGGEAPTGGSSFAAKAEAATKEMAEQEAQREEERRLERLEEEKRQAADEEARRQEERLEEEKRQAEEAQREEERRLARLEEEKRQAADEEARLEEERRLAKLEEEKRQAEEAQLEEERRLARLEEEKRQATDEEARLEEERRLAKLEEEKRQAEEAQREEERRLARLEEEKRQAADEEARLEEERRLAKLEEEKRQAEEAQREEERRLARLEEEKRQAADEEARLEEERRLAKLEEEKRQAEEAQREEERRLARLEEERRLAAIEEAAKAEVAAKEMAEQEAKESQSQSVTPRSGRAPPPPPKAGEARKGSKEGDKRPPPPPPKGKPARPGPGLLAVDTDADSLAGSAVSPAGSRAEHSLQNLWHSQQTPQGSAAPSPMAGSASGDEAPMPPGSPATSAPNTERGRMPRGPGPMPGPSIDTDFEDTLKSNASFMSSDSPGGRRGHSLGGLASSAANVVAADKKAGKMATPQNSARGGASGRPPIRAVVPTRSPRTEVQAQERLLGHTLPPQ